MNAEISHLHSKIAAVSYRLDALFGNMPQAAQAQYLIGQTITSAAPIGPGTKLGRCVFFPCDGGVYTYGGTSYRTPDFAGALVRACTESTPSFVGLKGVLGAVDHHTHRIGDPDPSSPAWAGFHNTFCRARGGLFDLDNVGSNDSIPFMCPNKYVNPYWPQKVSDDEIFDVDGSIEPTTYSLFQSVYGGTHDVYEQDPGLESLKVGLYFAICLLIE